MAEGAGPYGIIRPTLGLMADGAALSPERYRPVAIPLFKSLSTTTTSSSDKFTCPDIQRFLIRRILAHLQIADLSAESQAVSAVGNPSFRDRLVMKAANCRINIQNTSRTQKLIDGDNGLVLASLMSPVGDGPIDWRDAPYILMPGETVKVDMALIDTASDAAGGATEYGVVLEGILLRVGE